MKYPPLTTAALVNYNNLGPFSEVVPAEKMAELERLLIEKDKKIEELGLTLDQMLCAPCS